MGTGAGPAPSALCTRYRQTVRGSGGPDVEPIFVAGNPTCEELGYTYGFRVDPPNAGTYTLPDGTNTVTVTTDGVNFDWTSTLGMDAVIAKGGPNVNAYVYQPPAESKGDDGLHSPINPNNGQPFGLSHIDFCYDYEVDVTKTAHTSLDRTYTWKIEKSAEKTALELQKGEVYSLPYKIIVSNTSADSNWAVNGDITIKNPDPGNAATVTDVKDEISGVNDAAAVDCGGLPFTIPAGGTKTCTYSSPLPDGTDRTNTATVTTSAESKVGGGSGTAAVKFDGATTINKIDDMIKVSDTYSGGPQGVDVSANDAPKTFTYNRDISFDECGDHEVNNTASFVTNTTGTKGESSATVKVTIDCAQGCTLTIGYWKTHADPNSTRHDATQTLEVLAAAQPPITVGGNTVTATAGTYNVVSLLSFSGDPSKPINKLYAQLVAAKLNIANGADGSAVSTTIAQADSFLTSKQPNQNLSGPARQTAVSLAAALESFNSGGIGPGHCDEQ